MRFEWDESKNQSNLAKHHVSFDTARLVFDDPLALSRLDRTVESGGEIEERWQTLGLVAGVVVLLVAHLWREGEEPDEEVIRIISARKATAAERRWYEEQHFPD